MTASRSTLTSIARMGGWLLLALLLVLCVLSKGSTRVFTWPWVFYAQFLMVTPVLLAGWLLFRSNRCLPSGGRAVAFCAASTGVSVALSRNPHFSFEAALYLWGALAWTWWLAHCLQGRTSTDERFRATARLAGLALAAPMLSSLWHWSPMIAPAMAAAGSVREIIAAFGSARNPHPFGHWNYTGGYALIVLPWFVSLVVAERGRWRVGWIVAALLCPLLIFSSASRGAVLGALVELAAALGIAWLTGRISRRSGFWLLAGGATIAVFLALTNARLRLLLADPSALQYPSLGDVQRLAMLQGGWLLGLQRPWVGHGPGMVPFVYPEVRAQLLGGVETSYQLHNAYVHQWATTGVLGLVAGMTLGIALFRGVRRWLRRPAGLPRVFALGSASALAGYAAMAATDYQLDVIGILAALSLPAALLLAAPAVRDTAAESRVSLSGKIFGLTILCAGLAAIAVLIPHWRARQLHWSAWTETPETDRIGMISKLFEASRIAPWNTHYRNQLGLQLARDAEKSNDPAQRGLARAEFFSSLAIDPAQEPIHANLAWLWLPDDPFKAEIEFRRALALIPDRDTLHYGLAISRLATGNEPGAVRALALECLVDPMFIASPLWTRPDLAAVHPRVEAQLDALLERAGSHPAMPGWRKRDLAYFRAFVRWWKGGSAPKGEELAGADDRQRTFFATAALPSPAATEWPAPWRELAEALAHPATAASEGIFDRATEAARDGALARLQASASNVPALVRAETPPGIGVIGFTIERGHYPLMHRNLDGPGYLDLAPRVADAFRQRYAEPLFPPRGLIPGAVLVDLEAHSEK